MKRTGQINEPQPKEPEATTQDAYAIERDFAAILARYYETFAGHKPYDTYSAECITYGVEAILSQICETPEFTKEVPLMAYLIARANIPEERKTKALHGLMTANELYQGVSTNFKSLCLLINLAEATQKALAQEKIKVDLALTVEGEKLARISNRR